MLLGQTFPHIYAQALNFRCAFYAFFSFNLPGDTLAAPCLSGWKLRIKTEMRNIHSPCSSSLRSLKEVGVVSSGWVLWGQVCTGQLSGLLGRRSPGCHHCPLESFSQPVTDPF